MNIEVELKSFLKFGEGVLFFSFVNADGKRWLMPARNMRTAMNLYQPSGRKGKLVKSGLPLLYWNPVVLRILHAERIRLSLDEDFKVLLEKVFGQKNPEFAVFCGTPSVHRKITVQVCFGNKIAGYVKITASDAVWNLFEHEKKVLSVIGDCGFRDLPECLYCGTFADRFHIFIQSTVKTLDSKVLHEWTGLHSDYLKMLSIYTRRTLVFEDSDFFRDLVSLEHRLNELDNEASGILLRAIEYVRTCYSGKIVDFSVFHADFTPWNMFEENGKLFVFDWEYARLTYPSMLDYFHFMIQTAVFQEHLTAGEIVARFGCRQEMSELFFNKPYFYLKCYLLAIMSIYIGRETEFVSGETRDRISFWVELLELIEK